MELTVNEIINKIENNEINWDNVNSIKIKDKENIKELELFAKEKELKQMAKKIQLNSLYGALDNNHFFLNSRDLSGSITFVGRSLIKFTANKLNEKLSKLFGDDEYIIYEDTDSIYFSIEKFVKKLENKLNKKFDDMTNEEKYIFINYILKFINKQIQPTINEIVKEFQSYTKAKKLGFMGAKIEKINKAGIFVQKKRYALLTLWNEGSFLIEKPKISVTGLEVVRSNTPKLVAKKLTKALEILLNEEDITDFIEKTRKEFFEIIEKNPDAIAKIYGVHNIDYKKDKKGWYRIDENGKRIACPINSRGSILHNIIIKKHNKEDKYNLINEGDKVKLLKLKMPNPIKEDVICFMNENFLFEFNLIKYIDKEQMFDDLILQPLRNIVVVLDGVELEKKSNILDF